MKFLIRQDIDYISGIGGGGKFDLLKFVLSILVVVLHCEILPTFFLPLLRMAVPLFFIMSGYFFFLKIKNMDKASSMLVLNRYVLRICKLYLFWLVALLPMTIYFHMDWFDSGLVNFILKFIKGILFSGTFKASWFLSATVIGTISVYYLSRFSNNRLILIIGLLLYLLCAIDSNYYYLFNNCFVIDHTLMTLRHLLGMLPYSCLYSIIWIAIGKILAENNFHISAKFTYIILIAFISLFCLEFLIIRKYNLALDSTSYLCLLPVCSIIFIIIGQSSFNVRYSYVFRKYSTIIYCSHLSIFLVLKNFIFSPMYLFITTILISLLVSTLILRLENKKGFSWLKYAH